MLLPLIHLSLAFLIGVLSASIWRVPDAFEFLGLAIGTIGLVASRWRPSIRLLFLGMLVLVAGVWRYGMALEASGNEALIGLSTTPQAVTVRGVVDGPPEERELGQSIRLSVREVRSDERWEERQGTILVFTSAAPVVEYGDYLEASGKLEEPAEFESFNYREYLARQGIHFIMRYPHLKPMGHGRGLLPVEWYHGLRTRLSQVLGSTLPEPEASVAQGILIGVRSSMPRDLLDSFAATGTTHILAISGYNITVIAAMLIAMATRAVGRNRAAYVAIIGIVLYAILAGASPSVLRATMMGTLVIVAYRVGRQSHVLNALAVSAAILVGVWPEWLWDMGFQLSFLATAGLIFLSRPLAAILTNAANHVGLLSNRCVEGVIGFAIEGVAITLAATVYTLPITTLSFHNISLISPLANLLAVPALPPIIAGAAAVSFLGLISLQLAQIAAYLAWPFVAYMVGVISFLAAVPGASTTAPPIDPIFAWVYYSVLTSLTFALHLGQVGLADVWVRIQGRWQVVWEAATKIAGGLPASYVVVPPLIIAVAAWVAVFSLPDDKMHVTFLDVGQGDAILIRIPDNRKILVDGGPSSQRLLNQLGENLPFWDRTIDVVILSHPDEDHLAGLLGVLERYEVKLVLEAPLERSTPAYRRWREEIDRKRIRREVLQSGQRLAIGQLDVDVLFVPDYPADYGTGRSNDSLVLRLKTADVSFLLPGDIPAESQSRLLSRGLELKSTVLKVPHHGARDALDTGFLEAVDPQVAVISVGADNSLGHPAPETTILLAKTLVLRTDEKGAIEAITDGRKLWLKTRR